MSRRSTGLLWFLLLTFGITWCVEIGVLRRIAPGNPSYMIGIIAVMLVPGTCAFVVRRFIERGFSDAGLRWGQGRYYLWAWLAPAALVLVAMVFTFLLRQAEFDPYMTGLMVRMHAQAPNLKIPPLHLLQASIIATALTEHVILSLLPCFGEEFGWRGYLLMRLKPLGVWPAMIGSGAIWGLWHAPLILQGNNYPHHPLLGVPLMTGFCVLLGIILAWLRLTSGSVFTAALAHASTNALASASFNFMRGPNDITSGITGLIGQAVALVFIIALWRFGAFARAAQRDADSSGEQAQQESDRYGVV